jgi:hypothetical protein
MSSSPYLLGLVLEHTAVHRRSPNHCRRTDTVSPSSHFASASRAWHLILSFFPFLSHRPVRQHYGVKVGCYSSRPSREDLSHVNRLGQAGSFQASFAGCHGGAIHLEILGKNANAWAQGQAGHAVVTVVYWHAATLDMDRIVLGRDTLSLPRDEAFTVSRPSDDAFISGGVLPLDYGKEVVGEVYLSVLTACGIA